MRSADGMPHADHASSEATSAEDIRPLGYVLHQWVVEVAPPHGLVVAIRNLLNLTLLLHWSR